MSNPTFRPRVGFLGVGWIGRNRLAAIVETGAVEVVGIADTVPEIAAEAIKLAPGAIVVSTLDELLNSGLHGVVIATPSAMHAEQSMRALEQRVAVFCQKPLGRTAGEVEAVIETARAVDRLLGVDLSYRYTEAMRRVRELVRSGELGHVYAIDLVFHNAYGPDKAWFYDPALSGGGCVMDLGVHLVDLALWTIDFPAVTAVSSKLFSNGRPLGRAPDEVEDYAVADMETEAGATLRLSCSWRLHAGWDAIISATFHGTDGGAAMRNVNGSFYEFTAERYRGTSRDTIASPPDEWGGRAAVEWAHRLAAGYGFDAAAEGHIDVASVLDRIYGR